MPNQGEALGIVRGAARGPQTLPGRIIMSRLEKDFHSVFLQKIFSNSPVYFFLTLGHANVILDSKSGITLRYPAARSDWVRREN